VVIFCDGPRLIEHEVRTLVGQRVFGIALSYEDLVDHDQLRHDPTLAVLAGKLSARRKDCAPLAGKSTLNRLELGRPALTRYHRIAWDAAKIEALFVDLFEVYQPLYEEIYYARGDMENRIKECQLDLFADRTSAATGSPFRDNASRFEQAYSDARRNFARAVLWCHRVVDRRRARAYFALPASRNAVVHLAVANRVREACSSWGRLHEAVMWAARSFPGKSFICPPSITRVQMEDTIAKVERIFRLVSEAVAIQRCRYVNAAGVAGDLIVGPPAARIRQPAP